MPLTVADTGEEYVIKRIGGKPEVKQHLENLGFVVGSVVSVITTMGGNVIVKVKVRKWLKKLWFNVEKEELV